MDDFFFPRSWSRYHAILSIGPQKKKKETQTTTTQGPQRKWRLDKFRIRAKGLSQLSLPLSGKGSSFIFKPGSRFSLFPDFYDSWVGTFTSLVHLLSLLRCDLASSILILQCWTFFNPCVFLNAQYSPLMVILQDIWQSKNTWLTRLS